MSTIGPILPDQTFFTLDTGCQKVVSWHCSEDSPFCFTDDIVGADFLDLFPDYEHESILQVLNLRSSTPEKLVVVMSTVRKTYIRVELTLTYVKRGKLCIGTLRDMAEVENALAMSADERSKFEADAEAAQVALREWNDELKVQIKETDRAIKELWATRDANKQIIETAYDAFVSTDAEGNIVDWNAKAFETFGWSRDDVAGRNLTDTIVPPQFREAHAAGLRRFVATGVEKLMSKRLEISAIHKDGHEFPVQITFWHTRVGDSYHFHAFIHDISERKRSEQQLTRFFDLSLDLMCITSEEDGTFVKVNRAWETDLGWKSDQLVGTLAKNLVHPDDLEKVIRYATDVRETGTIIGYEMRLRMADGGYRTINWKSQLMDEEGLVYSVAQIVNKRFGR